MAAPFGDDPDRGHSARLLRAMREAKGWSREDLGERSGFAADTIKAFELGRRAVAVYHGQKFDAAFGTEGYKLFEKEAEPPAGVLREQFTYLAEVSHLTNVSVSVVPYKAKGHTGLLGAFVIAERRNDGSILYKEDIADGQVTDDPVVVADVALRFKSLQLEALPNGDSRDLIVRMAEEL